MGQQRSALTPERSALHLWGSELRALRDRRGLSLSRLGRLVRYDAVYLGRFERAERFPSKSLAESCDQALEADGELVRLWGITHRERSGSGDCVAYPPSHEANPLANVDFPAP